MRGRSIGGSIHTLGLACALLLAGTTATIAQSAVPSPTLGGEGTDRVTLLTRCQEKATNPDDLATCLDVVNRFLAPSGPGASAAPPVVNDSVTVKGGGEKSTEAFQLGGGDYIVTLNARDTSRSSFRTECTARGSLKLTDDNSQAATVEATAPSRVKGKTQSYIYGLDGGRYYWDFDLTTCGKWDVTLKSTVVDYAEPAPGPIVRSGKDTFDTEAFALTGGDYLVSTNVKAGAGECRLNAYLIPVAEYNAFSNVGDVSLDVQERKSASDESRLYSIDPGQYYWSVSTVAFAIDKSACTWKLTLTEQ